MRKKDIAFCYTTKDRVDITKKTLPAVLKESGKFDLYIIDGSTTDHVRDYVYNLASHEGIRNIAVNVTGGADVAIVYALSMMLDAGYEWVGLIENDVLLEDGWFDAMMRVKNERPGLGAISARSYSDRILAQCSDTHATMANIGAGMVLFSRRGAEAVLRCYRTGSLDEYRFWAQTIRGVDAPLPHEIGDPRQMYNMTADWFFESSIWHEFLDTVSCTPSLAHSADGTPEQLCKSVGEKKETLGFGPNSGAFIGHYDPGAGFVAQPHQIFMTFPEAYSGAWKLTWARHNGPFALTTRNGSFKLDVYGRSCAVLIVMDTDARVECGGALIEKSGVAGIQFGTLGMHALEFKVSDGEATFMTVVFDRPQHWFVPEGYPLRYSDLERYL